MNDMNPGTTNESAIDDAALAAAGGASRRTVLRGLAAALLGTASAGMAVTALEAKKRGKKGRKNKKKPTRNTGQPQPPTRTPTPKTCVPGEIIGRVSVMADGSAVKSPVLLKDVDYVLRPSGFWSTTNDLMQDAFAAFTFADPFSPKMFIDGVRTGLLMNNELPDIWGQYKPNHSYGLVVIGKGQPIEFRMLDSDYTGNNGVVHVDITCAVQRQQ